MLEASDIRKSYGSLEVLRGVSLSVAPAEVVAVVGPSGAGKSTLLQILGTLEKADAGRVSYDGVDISGLSPRKLAAFRCRNIGFVFQQHRLLPEFTLLENVEMPAWIAGRAKREARARAMSLIERLGLADRAAHKPPQLSGGESQRAAVARALMNSPRLILADEPSGSLDSHNRRELHDLFFSLRRELGQAFLIVTHDESLAAEADRTIHLADGFICP